MSSTNTSIPTRAGGASRDRLLPGGLFALVIAGLTSLIIRLTTLWFAIGIGLAVFPFAERSSMKAKHALETC